MNRRHPLTVDFRDDAGNVVAGTVLELRNRDDGTPADATLDFDGTLPALDPIDVGSEGLVTVWVYPGAYEFRGLHDAETTVWFPADVGILETPLEFYEQPDTPPADAIDGGIWVDTDEPPLAYAGGGGDAFAFFNG
jgi:hypothetical protein